MKVHKDRKSGGPYWRKKTRVIFCPKILFSHPSEKNNFLKKIFFFFKAFLPELALIGGLFPETLLVGIIGGNFQQFLDSASPLKKNFVFLYFKFGGKFAPPKKNNHAKPPNI